jgi:L-fuconolactonase
MKETKQQSSTIKPNNQQLSTNNSKLKTHNLNLRIDAHQHFWKFDPVRDSWINEEMSVIQRDFLPEHLEVILKENGLDGCVVVQSDQSEKENEFQLQNAAANDFIKGVVGWVDLKADDIEERLTHYKQFDKLKGFRHILQGEPQRDHMLRDDFLKGISLLSKFGYTYDILVFTDQLQYSFEFANKFPDQPFVIDHLAKPLIKAKEIDDWKKDISAFKTQEQVCCKISGMVTEADWKNWKKADFYPYLDVVVETFGMNRLMFGSDWPVCNIAASYNAMKGIVDDYFATFSQGEKDAFYGGNAVRFYKL